MVKSPFSYGFPTVYYHFSSKITKIPYDLVVLQGATANWAALGMMADWSPVP